MYQQVYIKFLGQSKKNIKHKYPQKKKKVRYMATNQLPVCLLVKDGYFVHHTAVRDQ